MKFVLLLILVGLLALGWFLYTPDRSQRMAGRALRRTGRSFYRRAGDQAAGPHIRASRGQVVLLLHGFGSSLETWEPWPACWTGNTG